MFAYTLHRELRFAVDGVAFAITESDEAEWLVEEVRKNGQEDCRMCGILQCPGGVWQWQWEQINQHGRSGLAAAVLAHIQASPPPLSLLAERLGQTCAS